MKVLFVHNKYQQAGGEDVALELEMQVLRRYGHQVECLYFTNDLPKALMAKIAAAKNAVYNTASAAQLERMIDEFEPDVVHVHNFFFQASPSVFSACKKKKIPVVFTLHNYRLICSNALLLRNNKVCELCIHKTIPLSGIRYKCYRHSAIETALVTGVTGIHKAMGTWTSKVDRYIVLTEFARSKFSGSSLAAAAQKFVVKPNYVPDYGEGAASRESFYLFVGRIVPEKGILTLLDAFSKTNYPLLIAGEGPEKEKWQNRYKHHAHIRFIGNQAKPSIIELMKKCRALVFPSIWYEGLPFTIIESFSTGTPVLASHIGSMQELIEEGRNGYFFTAGNPESLNEAVAKMEGQRNRDLYQGARQTFLERYTPEVHYHAIISIYKDVIEEKKNESKK